MEVVSKGEGASQQVVRLLYVLPQHCFSCTILTAAGLTGCLRFDASTLSNKPLQLTSHAVRDTSCKTRVFSIISTRLIRRSAKKQSSVVSTGTLLIYL